MKLRKLLKEKKEEILDKWFELLAKTYPQETAELMMRKRKSLFSTPLQRFESPAEYLFTTGLGKILDEITKEKIDWKEVDKALDDILRLRSLQDFTPSQAISFVFFLKGIVKSYSENLEEYVKFEPILDTLACRAFDVYMKCREDLYERRVAEVKAFKDMAMRALERVNLAYHDLEKKYEELRKKH